MTKNLFAVFALGVVVALSGCDELPMPAPAPETPTAVKTPTATVMPTGKASRNFLAVIAKMEPIAERECRARTKGTNCDFKIVVEPREGLPPNAYQTLDRGGRPIIAFTTALIADVRNQDELAFILGHEVSHHIRGHIPKQQQTAMAGAVMGGLMAAVLGAGEQGIMEAQRLGGAVGARSYSKEFELEADELGTIIAVHSGYDPVRGAAYFTRIPDPGDQFLGSHPPNAQRIAIVRRTAANM